VTTEKKTARQKDVFQPSSFLLHQSGSMRVAVFDPKNENTATPLDLAVWLLTSALARN
jgi:hypothetical protein